MIDYPEDSGAISGIDYTGARSSRPPRPGLPSRFRSTEGLCSGDNDLVVWHVA